MKYCGPEIRCLISGAWGGDLHHLITRKNGGTDSVSNLLPLAHKYHLEIHWLGTRLFAEKYPIVKEWLEDHNWTFDKGLNRWLAPSVCRK